MSGSAMGGETTGNAERLLMLLRLLERLRGEPTEVAPLAPVERAPPPPPPMVLQRVALDPKAFRLRREVGPLLRRSWGMAGQAAGAVVLHLTAAQHGEGVSTLAREFAAAASAMPLCRALLLDCHRGETDQSSVLGFPLPSLVEGWLDRGRLEVLEVVTAETGFHAACFDLFSFRPAPTADMEEVPARRLGALHEALRASYDVIVVDCPPVLQSGYFVPVAADTPEVLLVIEADRTRIPLAMRAKDEIAAAGGRLAGVVMNRRRQIVPRLLERYL